MSGRIVGRRPLLSVDARGYGEADGRRQVAIQQGLVDLMGAAAEAAGLRRDAWDCQKAGDGELAVLPADEPENVLIDDFVRALHEQVADYNEDRRDRAWLRLRLAIHNGIAEPAANGWAGAGPVVVSRLVNAAPIKAAQKATPAAGLVVIVSNRVFLDTVAQRHTTLRASRFRKVSVRVKEYHDHAWIHIPDHDVSTLDLSDAPPGTKDATPGDKASRGAAEQPGQRASVIANFHDTVTADVIGIQENYG